MKFITLFLLTAISTSTYSELLKIGYIDSEEVVNNLSQYEEGIEQIFIKFEPKKQELLDLFRYIELLRAKIITIKESEKKENLKIELSKLANLESNFQKETEFWQESINSQKIELLQRVELLINETISEIAISEKYDIIFYENAAFVSDKINISKKVIEKIQKL